MLHPLIELNKHYRKFIEGNPKDEPIILVRAVYRLRFASRVSTDAKNYEEGEKEGGRRRMTKKDVQKLAEEYVMKHKEHYGTVPKRELKQAVDKVAKVLGDLTGKSLF